MTQKLQELFNLAPTDEVTVEEATHTIEENNAILADVNMMQLIRLMPHYHTLMTLIQQTLN